MKRLPLLAVLVALASTVPAQAQSRFFEGKTIRIVVGFSPGGGYDTYKFGSLLGHATVNNLASDGVTGPNGEVDFGTGITDQKLWFQQNGNDLQIDLLGTTNHVTVSNWFGGNDRAQVQSINTADGLKLDTELQQLVSAMATYSANHPGFDPTQASQMPNDPTLQSTLASAWH